MKIDMTEYQPAFYINERGDVHTTAVFVSASDDSRIHTQLKHEICSIENEDDVIIVQRVDSWVVGVRGRHTPIGRIYVLAMLDPEYKP